MSTWNMPPGVSTNDIPGQEDDVADDRNESEVLETRQGVSPCNGCPTPGNCIDTSGCASAALSVPTYYVGHPDGTYSAANPQPRYVGPHMPIDTPRPAKVANKVRRSRVKLQPSPIGGAAGDVT